MRFLKTKLEIIVWFTFRGLDERLTPKRSLSRVSSQWKSQVKSPRKSTAIASDGFHAETGWGCEA